ncbi:MAG: hypothetical protein ACERKO_03175, partial [Acetanaerobacterium sp.]
MTAAIIIMSILFFGMQAVGLKKIQVKNLREYILLIGVMSGVVAVCFWGWGACNGIALSAPTVVYGLLFAVVFVATITSYYYAMQIGPLSYTAFFYSASMVIPSLAGVFIWKDEFRYTEGIGILLFLAAFYLISVPGAQESSKGNRKWMLLCLITWLLNGSLSVIVKAQQMALKGMQATSMTTVAFTGAFFLSIIVYAVMLLKAGENKASSLRKDIGRLRFFAVCLLAVAVGNGGGNFTVTYLSSRVSSAYLFPTVLGGMMVGITIYSVILLKEKIN